MSQQALQPQSSIQQATSDEISPLRRFSWNFTDTLVLTRRNLIYYVRQPELLIFATIQPVMLLLLFTYVFGGAIGPNTSGADGQYINYLLPGIIIQTAVFAATQTTVGLADDLSKGMIDRFRSLPMARSAVLAGRTLADSIRGLFTIIIMIFVGSLIGFRFQDGILNGMLGIGIAVLFGHAFTWISALIGLLVKSPEAANVAGFIWVFPLVFASSIFVPPETMPDWLRVFAENQPISAVANAVRGLFLGGADASTVITAIVWCVGIWLVFMPLSVWRYGKTV